jgi:hypothetical protein
MLSNSKLDRILTWCKKYKAWFRPHEFGKQLEYRNFDGLLEELFSESKNSLSKDDNGNNHQMTILYVNKKDSYLKYSPGALLVVDLQTGQCNMLSDQSQDTPCLLLLKDGCYYLLVRNSK